MPIKETLSQYIDDNNLFWPDIKDVMDQEFMKMCPGVPLTALKICWEIFVQQALSNYMSDQVAIFVQNTVAANQEFIQQYPNWTYETDETKETLTIFWNGKPTLEGEE